MGFDVTAANIIFFIAAITVSSAALGAYWHNADYVEDARRAEEARADERAHTNLTITDADYDLPSTTFTIDVKNTGSIVVDISELTYFVDGALVDASDYGSITVLGEGSGTDVLLPLETLEIEITSVTSSPSYFQIVAENGAKANWRL